MNYPSYTRCTHRPSRQPILSHIYITKNSITQMNNISNPVYSVWWLVGGGVNALKASLKDVLFMWPIARGKKKWSLEENIGREMFKISYARKRNIVDNKFHGYRKKKISYWEKMFITLHIFSLNFFSINKWFSWNIRCICTIEVSERERTNIKGLFRNYFRE